VTNMDLFLDVLNVRNVFHLVYLSVACGATSLLLTKSTVLDPMHAWLGKNAPFLGKMLSCPWCTSHWVALGLVLAYDPLAITEYDHATYQLMSWAKYVVVPLDYIVAVMVMVALSTVTMRFMYSTIKSLE
jgi:Protein of unknown function (DUF1360)